MTSMTMTILEASMLSAGWVRDPNCLNRWYAGHAGKLEPVFPLEVRVRDYIWLVTSPYGYGDKEKQLVLLMRFDTVASLEDYLARNGKPAEAAAAFSNAWD